MSNCEVNQPPNLVSLCWFLVLWVLAAPANCEDATLAIHHARLIIGNGEVKDNATVVIKGSRIDSVLGEGELRVDAARVIDARGKTVMPGLIDTHVHVFSGSMTGNRGVGEQAFRKELANEVPTTLKEYLRHGVTTVKSTGDPLSLILEVRDHLKRGTLTGPRLLIVGPGITAPNGHPASTILRNDPWWRSEHSIEVADAEKAREEVRRLKSRDVDAIKLVYHGGPYLEYFDADIPMAKLSENVMRAIIEEAHQQKLRATVHTWHERDAIEAIQAGADGLEHGVGHALLTGERLAKVLRERQASYVPTLQIFRLSRQAQSVGVAKKNAKSLADSGVRLALGTDTLGAFSHTPPGLCTIAEMELMAEAGVPAAKVIEATCRNAAEHLGLLDQVGTIQQGKAADLIIVDGDPLTDISAVRKLKTVVQAGKIVHSVD